jgi:transcriptional regulator with XRE-family HTH domain
VVIADRLRSLREEKDLSQGDIEKRTGLLRCYISRVEGGYTVPSIETLEKLARALEIPMYRLFYEGEEPPAPRPIETSTDGSAALWGASGKDARLLSQFRRCLGRMSEPNRQLLLVMAQKMARNSSRRADANEG